MISYSIVIMMLIMQSAPFMRFIHECGSVRRRIKYGRLIGSDHRAFYLTVGYVVTAVWIIILYNLYIPDNVLSKFSIIINVSWLLYIAIYIKYIMRIDYEKSQWNVNIKTLLSKYLVQDFYYNE
jgi:hypothetical protein